MDFSCGRPLPSARGDTRCPKLTAIIENTVVHTIHNRKPVNEFCVRQRRRVTHN